MAADPSDDARETADRIIKLAEEAEVASEASLDETALARDRAVLHAWVDSITGVVVTPGFARVTLIHAEGKPSTITSWDLCLALSELRNRA